MNFYLKSLFFLPILFLGLIFLPTQDFGPYGEVNRKEVKVGLADFKPPRDWETEVVDTDSGASASLALSKSGNPAISYIGDIDSSAIPPIAQLKFANHTGSIWQLSQVIEVSASNTDNSLQFDSSGDPRISYYAHFGSDLRYIYFITTHSSPGF